MPHFWPAHAAFSLSKRQPQETVPGNCGSATHLVRTGTARNQRPVASLEACPRGNGKACHAWPSPESEGSRCASRGAGDRGCAVRHGWRGDRDVPGRPRPRRRVGRKAEAANQSAVTAAQGQSAMPTALNEPATAATPRGSSEARAPPESCAVRLPEPTTTPFIPLRSITLSVAQRPHGPVVAAAPHRQRKLTVACGTNRRPDVFRCSAADDGANAPCSDIEAISCLSRSLHHD
jgi:hypothetical protein